MTFRAHLRILAATHRRFTNSALILGFVLLLPGISAMAQTNASVTLAWNPSSDSSVSGYRLYQGGSSGVYTNLVNVGTATNATVRGLQAGVRYFFAMTAYDTVGLESAYSTEVSYTPSSAAAPCLRITSPSAGASFTAPASIGISAAVDPNGHAISKVRFYSGSILLGESLTAPYTFTWGGVSAGSYTLTASVVYDAGSTVISAPVAVSVTAAALPPTITITSPANNSGFLAPASFNVAAAVNPNGHTITKVQFYSGTALLGEVASSPYTYNVNGLGAGSYSLAATAVYDQGSTVTSSAIGLTVTNAPLAPLPTLPAPWQSIDIGSPGIAGLASVGNGTYAVSGAGTFGGVADQFRYLYQPMTGKGEIRARIISQQNTSTAARAGMMLRETLAAGSEYVFIGFAPDGKLYTSYRTVTSAGASTVNVGAATLPNAWVRLVRSGASVYVYISADGSYWTSVNTIKVSMANSIYFGFAVESGVSSALSSSTFDSATIIP